MELTVQPSFSIDKPILEPDNGTITETVKVNFTPGVAGEYNERLVISGGGAENKIITLRVIAQGYELPPLPNPITSVLHEVNENPYVVKVIEGGIFISNAENHLISIYDITGTMIKSVQGEAGDQFIPVANGIYLIQIGDSTTKTIII